MIQCFKEGIINGVWMMRRNLKEVSLRQGAMKEVIEEVKGTGSITLHQSWQRSFSIKLGFTSPDEKE